MQCDSGSARILEFGCGSGRLSISMLKKYGDFIVEAHVTDIHPVVTRSFEKSLFNVLQHNGIDPMSVKKIKAYTLDARNPTFKVPFQPFDLIVSHGITFYLPQPRVIETWRKLLTPRGLAICSSTQMFAGAQPYEPRVYSLPHLELLYSIYEKLRTNKRFKPLLGQLPPRVWINLAGTKPCKIYLQQFKPSDTAENEPTV